jgi:hypothetical protein
VELAPSDRISSLRAPASRIFLDAPREIAGVLEELVKREAEREQPLDLGD